MIHLRKPKHESFHVALWNIASVAGITSAMFRSTYYVAGSTTIAIIYHIVVLIVDDDWL